MYHTYIIIITTFTHCFINMLCANTDETETESTRPAPKPIHPSPPLHQNDRYAFSPRRYHPKRRTIIIIYIRVLSSFSADQAISTYYIVRV